MKKISDKKKVKLNKKVNKNRQNTNINFAKLKIKIKDKIAINKENKNKIKCNRDKKILLIAGKVDKYLYYKTDFIRIKYKKLVAIIKNYLLNTFGTITYTINGLNQTKLLNILSKEVEITSVDKKDNLVVKVKALDKQKIEKILDNYGYKYYQTNDSNIIKILAFVFNKKVLTLATIIALFFYLYTNLLVLKIDINNSKDDVLKILNENNIKIGSMLKNVNTNKLERLIQNNLDISFCDIKIIGNSLKINITPAKTPIKQNAQDINKVVIASADCILSRQLIYSGTASKKFGDIIKKGDILVFNYIEVDENNKLPVIASGDIYGLIQKGKSITINKQNKEKYLTGNKKTITKLSFTNKFATPKSTYPKYKMTTAKGALSDILPIYYNKTTYYEEKEKVVKYDKNMVIKKYYNKLTNELISSLNYNAKYKRSFYEISENEQSITLTCYIEYEDKVSTLSS